MMLAATIQTESIIPCTCGAWPYIQYSPESDYLPWQCYCQTCEDGWDRGALGQTFADIAEGWRARHGPSLAAQALRLVWRIEDAAGDYRNDPVALERVRRIWKRAQARLKRRACVGGTESKEAAVATTEAVIDEVRAEVARQLALWGVQDHTPPVYYAILAEEVGGVAKAINDCTFDGGALVAVYGELVQVAAVAVSMLEALRRQGVEP